MREQALLLKKNSSQTFAKVGLFMRMSDLQHWEPGSLAAPTSFKFHWRDSVAALLF